MNIRLKFTKGKEVKYISHLDLMRVFQRAIRRTGIPISYSSGFNPHQEISFGAPLSLGVTSDAEYVDLKLARAMDVQEIEKRLNSSLPDGIRILKSMKLGDNPKSAMSVVTHARYRIKMNIENVAAEELKKSIEEFFARNSIKVMKEQPKKGFELKEIDIKPLIVGMKLSLSKEDEHIIDCLLLSGSRGNLKPELLMTAFKEFTGYDITGIMINREDVYAEKNGILVDLLEYES
ncbi:MAG TPA: TIGR03936 family radical SAM-associated protein [Clostridia bacterium]|nr:TIGR03936 family radical SAM-associated protein [Clostridia bacterium]